MGENVTQQTIYREPQYLDEVELLLGEPTFNDPELQTAVHEDFTSVPEYMLAARSLLYTRALRVIVNMRSQDRAITAANDTSYDAQEWNNRWVLTTKRIAEIAGCYKAEVQPIAQELRMRKRIVDGLDEEGGYDGLGLRRHQEPYQADIIEFLHTGPQRVMVPQPDGTERLELVDGAVVESPTGSGKTVVMASTAKLLGIGRDGRRLLIIVPSSQLVDQFTGQTGDDTFRRFLPGVSVTAYHHREKNPTGSVVVITKRSFLQRFRDGQLDGHEFDITFVDEGHHLTEPTFKQVFHDHVRGPSLLFTATTGYSETKDVKHMFPTHIRHASTLDFIEAGVLNNAQLFMFRVSPEDYVTELRSNTELADIDLKDPSSRAAVGAELSQREVRSFVLEMVRQGRRGMVFCEQGDDSKSARDLADWLNSATNEDGTPIILPDGKRLRAEPVGVFRRKRRHGQTTAEVIDDYNNGNVHVLTTVDTGREGLNADVDFVVVCCVTGSLLRLQQIVGRGTRRSKNFPTTIYAQFYTPYRGTSGGKIRTIYEAFGLEKVEQGVTIGAKRRGERLVRLDPGSLPETLRRAAISIHGLPLSEAKLGLGQEVLVPDHYISLQKVIEGTGYSELRGKYILQHAGYRWRGRAENTPDGGRTFVRYYEPMARDFLLQRNMGLVQNTIGRLALARKEGVSTEFLQSLTARLVEQGLLTLVMGRGANGKRYERYDVAGQEVVRKAIGEIPHQAEGDISFDDLARELQIGSNSLRERAAAVEISATYRRTKSGGMRRLLSASDADRLRAPYQGVVRADPSDMTRARIAILAGGGKLQPQLSQMMNELGVPRGTLKLDANNKLLEHWDKESGEELARQLKAWLAQRRVVLPHGLVPLPSLKHFFHVTDATLKKQLRKDGITTHKIALAKGPKTVCITWAGLARLERVFDERMPGAPHIDYTKLPSDERDTDPERVRYARAVQVVLYGDKRLGLDDAERDMAWDFARKLFPGHEPHRRGSE